MLHYQHPILFDLLESMDADQVLYILVMLKKIHLLLQNLFSLLIFPNSKTKKISIENIKSSLKIIEFFSAVNYFSKKFHHRCLTGSYIFHDVGLCLIDTSLLICSANQWTSVYMIETSVLKELILRRCFIHLVVGLDLCTTGIWRRSVNH